MKFAMSMLATLFLIFTAGSTVFARAYIRPARWQHARVANAMPRPSLSTDFRFNAVTVHGEYESPDEGIVTVENDKTLGDLLNYDSNYKSRLAEE